MIELRFTVEGSAVYDEISMEFQKRWGINVGKIDATRGIYSCIVMVPQDVLEEVSQFLIEYWRVNRKTGKCIHNDFRFCVYI